MLDAVYPSLSSSLGMHFGSGGDVPPRTGNRHGGLAEAPYNVYPASDGYIAIICVGDTHWRSLLTAMQRQDLADDPRFASLGDRVAHIDAVDALVGDWTRTQSKEALFAHLLAHRVPCAPVRSLDEVVHDPHMHERGSLQWQQHPDLGRIVVQHSPLRFAGTEPCELVPSRPLGADTQAVLADRLHLSPEAIAALRNQKVV